LQALAGLEACACDWRDAVSERQPEGSAEHDMQVREGMSQMVLTVGPGHTLRAVARLMSERRVGAAVVMDPDGNGPAIITERDILVSLGADEDPDAELVAGHLTSDVVYASPEWSLEEAAAAMVRGGFRHLIVLEGAETVGILSVRDIVRCWTDDGAICPVPARVAVG
jgi:CBS domain-containing protein